MQDAKNDLRRNLKSWLGSLEEESKKAWNKNISDNLDFFIRCSLSGKFSNQPSLQIGGYFPMQEEADWTAKFLTYSHLSFPQVDIKEKKMTFIQSGINDLEEVQLFGKVLKVPGESGVEVIPDLLVVPGLGFSESGKRLGRGGGFYDRYLSSFNGTVVGICYEGQLLKGVPVEPHDCLVSYVITEKRIIEVIKKE